MGEGQAIRAGEASGGREGAGALGRREPRRRAHHGVTADERGAALRRQERRVVLDVVAPADRPAAFWAADRQGGAVSAIEIPNGFHGAFQNAPTAVKQALDYLL